MRRILTYIMCMLQAVFPPGIIEMRTTQEELQRKRRMYGSYVDIKMNRRERRANKIKGKLIIEDR